MTPAANAAAVGLPANLVQRVLARFEVGCPSLRDHQIMVEVAGRSSQVVILPAAKRPKGRIELVFTPRGGLRSCVYPHGLTSAQLASIEDLAWALRESLGGTEAAPTPAVPEPA